MDNSDGLPVKHAEVVHFEVTNESTEYVITHDGESEDYAYAHYVMILMITQYIIFSITPFIIYPTIACIYPRVSSHLRQYFQEIDNTIMQDVNHYCNEEETKVKFVKHWKMSYLLCLFGANLITMACLIGRLIIPAPDVCDKAVDCYISNINAALSSLLMVIMVAMVFRLLLRYRRPSFISIISMLISLNIVYIAFYFFPSMLVTLMYDPLQAVYTSVIMTVIIISSYPIFWFFVVSLLFSKLVLKQAYFTLFSFTSFSFTSLIYFLRYFHIFIVCTFTNCYTLFVISLLIPRYGSHKFHGYHNLVILWFIVALFAICMFKPVHHFAYKYATAKAKLMASSVFPRDNPLIVDEDKTCDNQIFIRANLIPKLRTSSVFPRVFPRDNPLMVDEDGSSTAFYSYDDTEVKEMEAQSKNHDTTIV